MREQHERERVDDTLFLEQAGDPSRTRGADLLSCLMEAETCAKLAEGKAGKALRAAVARLRGSPTGRATVREGGSQAGKRSSLTTSIERRAFGFDLRASSVRWARAGRLRLIKRASDESRPVRAF